MSRSDRILALKARQAGYKRQRDEDTREHTQSVKNEQIEAVLHALEIATDTDTVRIKCIELGRDAKAELEALGLVFEAVFADPEDDYCSLYAIKFSE